MSRGRAPVSVPVQVLVASDDDGRRRARATPAQIARWVAFANHAYRDAGVHFAFDPQTGVGDLRSTMMNDMHGRTDPGWPAVKAHGNGIAAGRPGRLVVIVRHGPGATASGAAFAGTDHDFVVMGGFEAMRHCGHPHVDALAHEIGHFLGLPHTFVGEPFQSLGEAAAHLESHGGDPRAFDGDGFTDTLPDPLVRAFECERRASVELGGQVFVLPRRNLMSYYDERDSLSPQQIARALWVLERRRAHRMRLPVNRPGPIALEAQALRVLDARGCSPQMQAMDSFGEACWSAGAQLFCSAGLGAELTLELPARSRGTFRIVLYATLAPDFGVIQCALDGRPCGSPIDLYAPIVLPTGAIALDSRPLSEGTHRIALSVVGKHAASKGHRFGIDAIELIG